MENEDIVQSELFEHFKIKVDQNQSPCRIDKFLMQRLPNITRTKIQDCIKMEYAKVNNETVKSNKKIKGGDEIVLSLPYPPRDEDILPEKLDLNIVYEDNDILVINKPAGMVVHPAYKNWEGTLVNGLIYHFDNLPEMKNNKGRPGLVHRIDKDTSGLLVIAKNETAMKELASQFFDHSIERTYWALVWGTPEPENGTIDVNLGRSLKDRRITTAFPNADMGQTAITHYQTLKSFYYVTLVQCNLETGRTHQIRAHMKYIGNPIFNDAVYGGNEILKGTVFTKYKQFVNNCFKILNRQALHAKTLGFIHPTTKEKMFFESELPQDFNELLKKWEKYTNAIQDN